MLQCGGCCTQQGGGDGGGRVVTAFIDSDRFYGDGDGGSISGSDYYGRGSKVRSGCGNIGTCRNGGSDISGDSGDAYMRTQWQCSEGGQVSIAGCRVMVLGTI